MPFILVASHQRVHPLRPYGRLSWPALQRPPVCGHRPRSRLGIWCDKCSSHRVAHCRTSDTTRLLGHHCRASGTPLLHLDRERLRAHRPGRTLHTGPRRPARRSLGDLAWESSRRRFCKRNTRSRCVPLRRNPCSRRCRRTTRVRWDRLPRCEPTLCCSLRSRPGKALLSRPLWRYRHCRAKFPEQHYLGPSASHDLRPRERQRVANPVSSVQFIAKRWNAIGEHTASGSIRNHQD